MNPQTVALDDLAQRISELKTLQREYHARQAKVAVLQRRARKLKNQLDQVRNQIDALTQGSEAHAASRPAKGKQPAAKPSAVKTAAPKTPAPKLADLIVEIVGAAGRPMGVTALAEEVARRDFPTTSANLNNLVKSKVSQMVSEGVLRRAARRQGVVLHKPKSEAKAPSPKPHAGMPSKNGAAPAKMPATRNGQPSLHSVLTGILEKSSKPLSAQELADRVRATGYKSKSKDFRTVVWTALGKMKAVNVPGEGFRLK